MPAPDFSNEVDLIDVVVPGVTQVLTVAVPGPQGPPGSFVVGTVTTGVAGSSAAVNVTTNGSGQQVVNFTIPRGNAGANNVLSIGTVTTTTPGGSASATITGTSPTQTLNLTLPQGTQGPQGTIGNTGPPNSLSIGTVTTGAAGSSASASITGTAPSQTLSLTIPRGDQGVQGIQGIQGIQGVIGNTGPQGPQGVAGQGIAIAGQVATYANLPTGLTGADSGKGYLVNADGLLYIWTGSAFPPNGSGVAFQGPAGPANSLTLGTVTTGAAGSSASGSITGTPPSQTLALTIPRGNTGLTGPANSLAIGTVTTGAAGSSAAATITGTAPTQTLNLTIPTGATGSTGSAGPSNTITIGTVTALAAGATPTASLTGTSPNQTLNLGIPAGAAGTNGTNGSNGATGPANTLTIGTVTTGAAGSSASATITGTAPNQTLNLTIPQGTAGAGAPDATTTSKGSVKLAGDLAGTADLPTVPGLTGKANNTLSILAGTGLSGGGDLTANRSLSVTYGSATGTAVEGNDARVVADQVAGTASIRTLGTGAQQAVAGNDARLSDARTPTAHTHPSTAISDSTAVGRSVIVAVDAAAARTAIGAGTSSLAIGTTSTTAKAGDYAPPSDGAAGVATMRTLGTSATSAAAGNDSRLSDARTPTAHTHVAVDISNSTAIGRTILTAVDGPAVRTAIGAGTSSLVIGTTGGTAADGGTLATHTAATAAHGTTGAIVGTTDTQTLTNKTVTAPIIPTFMDIVEITAPASPALNNNRLYVDSTSKSLAFVDNGGLVRRMNADRGTGTVFPTVGIGRGDFFFHTGLATVMVYTGTAWRQASVSPAANAAARTAISTTYSASLYGGFKVYQTDTSQEWTWSGSAWQLTGGILPSVMVRRTTAGTNATASTWSAVTWQAQVTDGTTDTNMWVVGTPTRLIPTVAGMYVISGSLGFNTSATNRYLGIRKNGSASLSFRGISATQAASAANELALTKHLKLTTSDYVELVYFSGVADAPPAFTTEIQPTFQMSYVGAI